MLERAQAVEIKGPNNGAVSWAGHQLLRAERSVHPHQQEQQVMIIIYLAVFCISIIKHHTTMQLPSNWYR
jgi:hypothetical protein